MYGTPSPENEKAKTLYGRNRFSVTRQLRYSNDNAQLALDLCLFINGLPVATFELKNSLTKQTVAAAVQQYKQDRNPKERLFELGRCLAHFAIDEQKVQFCTHLEGKASWFLPFDKGWDDGAGNPPKPKRPQDGLPVEGGPHPRRADGHHRELRPDRGDQGRQDRPPEAGADMAPLPPARRRPEAAGRRVRQGRRSEIPDPALGGQRQVQLHRVAGPPAHRSGEGRYRRLRHRDRRHGPEAAGQADQGHHQAVRPGRLRGGRCQRPPATSGRCCGRASGSSSRPCRSSRSSWTPSATSTAGASSPSSSTRRIRARAGGRRRRCRWRSGKPAQ